MVSAAASFLRYWLPVVLWALIILGASTSAGSAHHTSRFFKPLLRWLWPGLGEERIEQAHFLVRKAAHAAEYAVLAALLVRALRRPARDRTPSWRWRDAGLAVALAGTTAAVDETFQSLSDERSGSAADVLIDCAGAGLGAGLCWSAGRLRRRW
jgi:VanZ family protein